MPGGGEAVAVGVEEDYGGGEVMVVVDDVGKVGHCFVAFVDRDGEGEGVIEGGGGGVDGVDGSLPAVLLVRSLQCFAMEGARKADSGRYSSTQSVSSDSRRARTMILSWTMPSQCS